MPSPPASLPAYVERDGDWVWQAPGHLTDVTMHLFVLRAAIEKVEELCEEFVTRPTGSVFRAQPVPPGLVVLTCADIRKGWSGDPRDQPKGWMMERDIGFFVPVVLSGPTGGGVVNLLPYLYVDNFAAVVIGREIFGFPKVLGDMQFSESPVSFSVCGQAIRTFGTNSQVDDRALLVSVRETAPGASDDLVEQLAAVLGRPPSIEELIGEACGRVAAELAGMAPARWVRVPMAFLKQFRDVAVRDKACHASLVRADAAIDALRSLRILGGRFEVELPRYDSLRIAERLGLGASPIRPAISLRAMLDFTLPHGRAL